MRRVRGEGIGRAAVVMALTWQSPSLARRAGALAVPATHHAPLLPTAATDAPPSPAHSDDDAAFDDDDDEFGDAGTGSDGGGGSSDNAPSGSGSDAAPAPPPKGDAMARAFAKVMAADARSGPGAVLAGSKSVAKRAADDGATAKAVDAARALRRDMRRRGHMVGDGGGGGKGFGVDREEKKQQFQCARLPFFQPPNKHPSPSPRAAPTPSTTPARKR